MVHLSLEETEGSLKLLNGQGTAIMFNGVEVYLQNHNKEPIYLSNKKATPQAPPAP